MPKENVISVKNKNLCKNANLKKKKINNNNNKFIS